MTRDAARAETVMDPTSVSAAGVYAEALLGQVPSNAEAETVADELDALIELLDGIEGFESLLTSALIEAEEKCEMIRRIFHGRSSEAVEALLLVMADANRLGLLRTLRRVFRSKLNVRQGKMEVTVTSAAPLTDAQREQVRRSLAEALKGDPVLTCQVDPDLLGGVVVQVGDHVYDASIRAQLSDLQSQLRREIELNLPRLAGPDKAAS